VQTRSQYGPTLDINSRAVFRNARLRGQSENTDSGEVTARLRQPLYTGGRLRGSLAAARANILSGEQALRQSEADTIRDVIIAYASVVRDEQLLAVSRENVTVLRDQLRENRARRRVEDVTLTDVAQADARLAAAEYQLAGPKPTWRPAAASICRSSATIPARWRRCPTCPGCPAPPTRPMRWRRRPTRCCCRPSSPSRRRAQRWPRARARCVRTSR
jgi:outer membrane protein/S-layer protein transport system outer membrane protein